ncbi:hypothetical protein BJ170DRAFT_165635 [Xylariales sp. AK1849]|nr:hypothetical protein BJ170DRAFT_165635 [Xylariales sp. AK1849]
MPKLKMQFTSLLVAALAGITNAQSETVATSASCTESTARTFSTKTITTFPIPPAIRSTADSNYCSTSASNCYGSYTECFGTSGYYAQ